MLSVNFRAGNQRATNGFENKFNLISDALNVVTRLILAAGRDTQMNVGAYQII